MGKEKGDKDRPTRDKPTSERTSWEPNRTADYFRELYAQYGEDVPLVLSPEILQLYQEWIDNGMPYTLGGRGAILPQWTGQGNGQYTAPQDQPQPGQQPRQPAAETKDRTLMRTQQGIYNRDKYGIEWKPGGRNWALGEGNYGANGEVKGSLNKYGQPLYTPGAYGQSGGVRGQAYGRKLTAEQAYSMGDEVWYRWRLNNLWDKDPRGLHDWKPTPQDYRRRNDRLKGDNPLLSSENGGLIWQNGQWVGNPAYLNNDDDEEEGYTDYYMTDTPVFLEHDPTEGGWFPGPEGWQPSDPNWQSVVQVEEAKKATPSYSYNDLINWRI